MQSASSSSSSSRSSSPVDRSRGASRQAPPSPVNRSQSPGSASARWNFCLSNENDEHSLEPEDVTAGPSPLSAAAPSSDIKKLFRPSRHLTLDSEGLRPNYSAINNCELSGEETAQLLNHARKVAQGVPLAPPWCFDPARHALPNGGPDIPGILGDTSLSQSQRIEVYRWARIYAPDTMTDPTCLATCCVMGTALPAAMLFVTGAVVLAIYLTGTHDASPPCSYLRMNATEANALLQAVHEQFPSLVNATLNNMDEWVPLIKDRISQGIYRDGGDGHLLQQVCASLAQALDPVAAMKLLFLFLVCLALAPLQG
ncbi:MAG: hypothetical protein GXD23_06070 [Comamonadaceae bacterium]|jgi:hypothetical protein|uniref:hypothetical protein n=1 Tax=Hydrogenophaga sp. SNF1 TaxID=3098762 RepID=UPI002ACBEEBB|nr:hypothetical protein [Hydrogenophaga sp. SNF1]NCT96918.1 hypothetical protein [Comamonadaceae bacterium]WQB84463.1 hypothetical protein SOM08_03865 [Hydrogenophaga sp. SNF1]